MNPSLPSILRAVGFASLVQLVWVPALLIDAFDQQRQANRLAESASNLKPTKAAWGQQAKDPMALLLQNDDVLALQPSRAQTAPPADARTGRQELPTGPVHALGVSGGSGVAALPRDALGILRPLLPGGFTPAELLGGPLTLASLREVPMPALARAERARWQASGDPLAPLGSEWREPMRQAMRQLGEAGQKPSAQPQVQQAQMVHVPSVRIRSSEQVPVAIHADGTVQVLRRPAAKEALRDIEDWSQRQALPEPGKVMAAVVSLEPLPPPIAPGAATPAPAALPPEPAAQVPQAEGPGS